MIAKCKISVFNDNNLHFIRRFNIYGIIFEFKQKKKV